MLFDIFVMVCFNQRNFIVRLVHRLSGVWEDNSKSCVCWEKKECLGVQESKEMKEL